jgi:hypothetical protein
MVNVFCFMAGILFFIKIQGTGYRYASSMARTPLNSMENTPGIAISRLASAKVIQR